jgi:hypothetical protein
MTEERTPMQQFGDAVIYGHSPEKFRFYVHGLYILDAVALMVEAEVPHFTVLDDRAGSGAYRVDIDWMGMDTQEHPPMQRMWLRLNNDHRYDIDKEGLK